MTSLTVYDHVRLTDRDCPEGIYRVVGVHDEAVTLLRVGDADGQRVNSGEVVTIALDELSEVTPAANPDGNRPLRTVGVSKLEARYWSIRVFVQQLAAHPLSAAVAVTLVGFGVYGDRLVSLPDIVQGGLILIGSLGLAYIGSSRL